jgi:hypothetical protein
LDEDQEERVKKIRAQREFIKQKAVTYAEDQAQKKINLQQIADMMNKAENAAVSK